MTGMSPPWTKAKRGMRVSERPPRGAGEGPLALNPVDVEECVDGSRRRALEAEIEEACRTYDIWRAAVLCEELAVIHEACPPRRALGGASAVRRSLSGRMGW